MTGSRRNLPVLSLILSLCLPLATVLPASLPVPQGRMITWQAEFDAAMEMAKSEKRVIFIAINMEGERANDEAVRVHYRDSRILSLSKHCVNLFATADQQGKRSKRFSGLTYQQANRIEMRVREQFLKIPADKDVVAPQHLFLSPEGKILLSVPYRITVGELEWMFAEALKKNDPDFRWKLDGRARAPKRLKYGYEVPEPAGDKRPDKEEIEKILDDLKKGKLKYREIADKIGILIRSDDPDAIKYVNGIIHLRWISNERRAGLIDAIGKNSPKPWSVLVEPFVSDQDDEVRLSAIIAVAALGEKKALKSLKKQFKKEEDIAIKGRCLRAMAKLGPKDRSVIAAIKKLLKSKKTEEELRMNGIVAVGLLEDRKVVTDLLGRALGDPSPKLRSTAAYAIGVRRDKVLLENVRVVLQMEKDEGVKHWLEAAVKSIEGSNEESFKDFLGDVVGD